MNDLEDGLFLVKQKKTKNGKTATVKEFADEYDIAYSCLYARLRNGWSVEKALLTPANKIKKMTNAQKIRAMSDEELAEWMAECNAYKENADASQWLPWLKQPAE